MFTDHLGSTAAIAQADNNTFIEQMDYDAFGKRRDLWTLAELASGNVTTINKLTTKGFTGHEMVDEVGLVHMNGRVYDPKLGRFMSADPFITEIDNTQNMNRYSYVYNNPLTMVDPSGFQVLDGQLPGSAGGQYLDYAGWDWMGVMDWYASGYWGIVALQGIEQSAWERTVRLGVAESLKYNELIGLGASVELATTAAAMVIGQASPDMLTTLNKDWSNDPSGLKTVIEHVVTYIDVLGVGYELAQPEAVDLLLATAVHESELWNRRQDSPGGTDNGPARGMFGIQPSNLEDLYNNYFNNSNLPERRELQRRLESLMVGTDQLWNLQHNDLYGAAIARLSYYRAVDKNEDNLPAIGDRVAQADYWGANYNTQPTKAKMTDFLDDVNRILP